MSDTPQGPDWWQASDDKWYPPPRPAMPGDTGAGAAPAAVPGVAPPGGPPAGPPVGPPTGPPVGPPTGGYPGTPPSGGFPAGPPSGGFPPGAPGSYGGVPPAAPSQNKTPLYVAIGVVVAAAVVGLIVVLSGGDDDEPTASPSTTESTATTADGGPATTGGSDTTEAGPSGSAEIAVVESGFSNFMGGFDQDEKAVAYGFIVENSGDDTATDISVSVSAYDAAGTALASASHTIYVLRPGEKVGIGDEFFGTTFTTDVADLQVQVSEPSDFGSDDVPAEGTLTAEGISTTPGDYDITTTFTASSTYAQQIDSPYAYAIYRDEAGTIIGGSTGYMDFIPANGSTAGEVSSWDPIPGIATTEIYLDPGWF